MGHRNNDRFDEATCKFVHDVKNSKFQTSHILCVKTVELFKTIISKAEYGNADELISLVRAVGKKLIRSLPLESTLENMVHRVLKIIRDEYVAGQKEKGEDVDTQESLHKIITTGTEREDYMKTVPDLKASVIDHIAEFEMELDTSIDNIANQAGKHIHSNEIIMTLGRSPTVEQFLKQAAKTRKFRVIVVQCASSCEGNEMALSLAKSGITTTLIPDTVLFAMMSRANKVIVGTHTVTANGGLRAICGSSTMARAAQHHSVPVYVLAPMYKLSRYFLCSMDQNNVLQSPNGVLNYSDGGMSAGCCVLNPLFDYVPPELVTLFISNIGGHAPSYMYRLISELYHPDDNDLGLTEA